MEFLQMFRVMYIIRCFVGVYYHMVAPVQASAFRLHVLSAMFSKLSRTHLYVFQFWVKLSVTFDLHTDGTLDPLTTLEHTEETCCEEVGNME